MCIGQVNVYIAYQLFCNRCHYIICEIIFHELSFIFVNGECICYVPYVCCNCCSFWLQTVTLKSILFPPSLSHGECPTSETTQMFIRLCEHFIEKTPTELIGEITLLLCLLFVVSRQIGHPDSNNNIVF